VKITITRHRDGSVVLHVMRADGTIEWQKQSGQQAAFFPLHDLTHYAVESELGITAAFWGLLASGWSIEDTTGKGRRGALPVEAVFVEAVVGTLDVERASGTRWTADEFNDSLGRHIRSSGRTVPRVLTDDELRRIRRRRAELFEQWAAIPPGGSLQLDFSR
jgi:hypothetical protein